MAIDGHLWNGGEVLLLWREEKRTEGDLYLIAWRLMLTWIHL